MRRGVPNDGTVGWPGVDTAHGRRSDHAVLPRQGEVRSLRGAPLGGDEGDQIRRQVGGVEHDGHVILSVCQRCLDGFGDVKGHPIIADAVHQVNKTTHIGADATATKGRPVVHTVVRCGVGRRGPTLQNRAGGDGFSSHRTVLCKDVQISTRHARSGGLRDLAEWNSQKRRSLVARRSFTDAQRRVVFVS